MSVIKATRSESAFALMALRIAEASAMLVRAGSQKKKLKG